MSFRARSLRAAARAFCDHLNLLLHASVTQTPLSFEIAKGRLANVRVRGPAGQAGEIPLRTRYGPMALYIGHLCDASRDDDGQFVLRTINYRYALTPLGRPEPLLRWEYVRFVGEDDRYCQHHLQGPLGLGIHDRSTRRETRLQDWHLPTGWVPLEEILRFCIVDLGVRPLREDWDAILTASLHGSDVNLSSPGT